MDEKELVRCCGKNDPTARQELYERYAGRLYAVCLRYSGSQSTAEDILHDSFIKIYRNIGKFNFRGDGSLLPWMRRIVVNTALDSMRRQASSLLSLVEEPYAGTGDDPPPDVAGELESLTQAEILSQVARLPDTYRIVFNLRCIDGYPHKEIGRLTGVSERTASSQYFRARMMLQKMLKEYITNKTKDNETRG